MPSSLCSPSWLQAHPSLVPLSALLRVVLPLLLLLGLCVAQAQAQNLRISEFRLSGPGGTSDEFIEIYNPAQVPFDAAGWTVGSSSLRVTIPAGKTLRSYGYLLVTAGGYSLSDYGGVGKAAGDVSYDGEIPSGSSLELRDAAGHLVDQVNPGVLPSPLSASDEHSYVRRLDSGVPLDTDDDLNDFNLVNVQSTEGPHTATGISNGLQRLGAPGPQNRHSLVANNAIVSFAAATSVPAVVRTGSGNSGTLAMRQTVTNWAGSGRTVTAFRFRIVALTAGNTTATNATGGQVADIRLISSQSIDGTILPLLLQQPPAQPNDGGLNSTAVVDLSVLPGGGLSPGQSVTVEFLFKILKTGTYRYLLNAEPDPSPAQPDLVVRTMESDEAPDFEPPASAWTGAGVFSMGAAGQTISSVSMVGLTQRYALRLTNAGEKAMAFRINLPAPPAGWTVRLFDALHGGTDITAPPGSATDWATPQLAPGASLQLRLEATPSATATATYDAMVTAWCSFVVDAVKVSSTVQKIEKIQWSSDGTTWSDFDATIPARIELSGTLGVRAVKSAPALDWPEPRAMGPKWNWQGGTVEGETVWIQGKALTPAVGQPLTAEFGSSIGNAARVVKTPAYDVTLTSSQSSVLSGAGPLAFRTTALSIAVADDDDAAPQAGVSVRVRALTSNGTATGELGAPGTADDVVTTNAQGVAQITWTSGAEVGEIRFEAVPLDASAVAVGVGSTLYIHTNPAYTRLELGPWTEVAGAWSRTVKATVKFMGQKVAGRTVTLAPLIKDDETGAPLAGWQNAAPLDATTGTTDANGTFTTVQRWNPVETGAWPHDYDVSVNGS